MAALRAQAAAKWQAGRYSSVRLFFFFLMVERHWFFFPPLMHRDRSIGLFDWVGSSFPLLAPSNCTFSPAFPKHETTKIKELDPLRLEKERGRSYKRPQPHEKKHLENSKKTFQKKKNSAPRPTPRSTRLLTTLLGSSRCRRCGGACSPSTLTTSATGTTAAAAKVEEKKAREAASPLSRRQPLETGRETWGRATAAALRWTRATRTRGRPLPSRRSTPSSRPLPASRAPRQPGRRPRRRPSTH